MSAGDKFRVAGRRKRWKFPSCIVFSLLKHYNGRPRPRGVFAASDKSPTRSRKTPFDLGCSRDTSRGCVGRRCTVLSYTFRSHPYQNTVERGCCSKVFFGLRKHKVLAPVKEKRSTENQSTLVLGRRIELLLQD